MGGAKALVTHTWLGDPHDFAECCRRDVSWAEAPEHDDCIVDVLLQPGRVEAVERSTDQVVVQATGAEVLDRSQVRVVGVEAEVTVRLQL